MLAGAARGGTGSKGGGGPVRLSDVNTQELAADVVGGGIWEFMNNADGPAFLERELVGLGVDGYRQVRVCDRASGPVPIHTFREYLSCHISL